MGNIGKTHNIYAIAGRMKRLWTGDPDGLATLKESAFALILLYHLLSNIDTNYVFFSKNVQHIINKQRKFTFPLYGILGEIQTLKTYCGKPLTLAMKREPWNSNVESKKVEHFWQHKLKTWEDFPHRQTSRNTQITESKK